MFLHLHQGWTDAFTLFYNIFQLCTIGSLSLFFRSSTTLFYGTTRFVLLLYSLASHKGL